MLLVIFLLLATISWPPPAPPPPAAGRGMIAVAPVAFGGERAGALRFVAGWALSSGDDRFGGLSGLHIEGGEATALSDTGMIVRFPLPERAGRLPVRFEPLLEGPGPRARKSNRDSEALLIRGGALWVAFESRNAVWRYRRADLRTSSSARPVAMRRWRGNSGAEAMVRLAGGSFLVFAEGRSDSGRFSDVLLFRGDPAVAGTATVPLRYRRPPGYRPTDAALLADGRLLVLNRRLDWWRGLAGFTAVLVVARIGRNGIIEGHEIARLEPPLAVDNMEALAVTNESGRTIVWLASDDNFSPLQRTLLLKFELRL